MNPEYISGGDYSYTQVKSRPKKNKWLLIFVGIVLVSAGIYFYFNSLNTDEYESLANSYMKNVSQNNSQITYEMLTENAKKRAVSPDEWKKNIDAISKKFPSKCSSITDLGIGKEGNVYSAGFVKRLGCDFTTKENVKFRLIFVMIKDSKAGVLIDEMQGYAL